MDALRSPSGLFILCRFVRLLCEARFQTLLQKLRGISHAQKCLVNCLSTPFTSLFCRQSHNRAETANSRFLKPVACQSFVHFIGRDEKLHGEQRSHHCVSPLCLTAVSRRCVRSRMRKGHLVTERRTGSNCFDALLSHICVDPKELKAGKQVSVCQ